MVSVISPATVSQFFFIPHQDCLVPLGKRGTPLSVHVCFSARRTTTKNVAEVDLWLFTAALNHGWDQHSYRNWVCQLSLPPCGLSSRAGNVNHEETMAGLGGYLLLFSKYILMTEWKMARWESKLYSHRGQDHFLGYNFLFSLPPHPPPTPLSFNFWKLFNREGKWLRNVWEWFGRMESVA